MFIKCLLPTLHSTEFLIPPAEFGVGFEGVVHGDGAIGQLIVEGSVFGVDIGDTHFTVFSLGFADGCVADVLDSFGDRIFIFRGLILICEKRSKALVSMQRANLLGKIPAFRHNISRPACVQLFSCLRHPIV